MESQEQSPGDVVTAGEDSHPITQAIDTVEVTHAGATAPAANTMDPPTIPLAPMKRMQARFNPLADGLMYVVVFVGGFVGVGCRHALDMLLPSVSGTPFVVGTFVSNMVACFLFAMLTEFMATASWLRRRVRQVVSRGVGLGLLGGLSTMSGVMLETMEGLHERHIASALGYLAGNFAGGLLTAAAGVVLMQALLSRSTRKRVRGAFSAVSVSDSAAGCTPCESGRRGAFCRAGRNGSRADGPADCTDGTGSASRNTNRAADRQPAYADRPRSADSSAGRSSADAAGASVAARAGYSRLGAAARDSAVAANPAAGQPASTQLRAQTDHCGDFACRRPDYRGGALMMWMICLFGGLGAMARYVLDVSIQRGWNRENRRTNRNFPLSTLVINGVASLCAGIAMMSYYSQSVDMDTVMMFVVGFLGGFSTFSTALNEVVSLIRQRRFTLALGYGIATVAVPLICVAAGFGIALLANPA
jgi:protein CrcB